MDQNRPYIPGCDTTANTIIFSSINSALHSNVQDRIIEDIDHIYEEAEKAGREELSYTEDFPKFRYLLVFTVCLSRRSDSGLPALTCIYSTKSCASSPSLSQSVDKACLTKSFTLVRRNKAQDISCRQDAVFS